MLQIPPILPAKRPMKPLFMDVTIMPAKSTPRPPQLLLKLRADYPELSFVESGQFAWHAGKKHVSYQKERIEEERGVWAILHELGHALLAHTDYESDIELLQIEVAAWEKAHELAKKYRVRLDQDYVEDCLDSYRDWLHVRATCPTCYGRSLQTDRHTYSCHNCGAIWHVTRSRLCRPYRRKR
ncbi:hypothetical protein IPL68_04260 [Candidatus Saccharibacteria bacterium]|nr:MAG: hypothetical protein IPL68_04260 [Candidatus Saccharibacteria bacterium]